MQKINFQFSQETEKGQTPTGACPNFGSSGQVTAWRLSSAIPNCMQLARGEQRPPMVCLGEAKIARFGGSKETPNRTPQDFLGTGSPWALSVILPLPCRNILSVVTQDFCLGKQPLRSQSQRGQEYLAGEVAVFSLGVSRIQWAPFIARVGVG